MRHNRPLVFTFAVCTALLGGCAIEDGTAQQKDQAMNPWASSSLAYPEYDLNVPANGWWMHDATGADIQTKMAEGFRLHDVDYLSNGHLTATFVANTAEYAREGNGFDHGLTDSAFQAIVADTTRRVVDIAQRGSGSGKRWAVVWVANTGTQMRASKVVTNATQQEFEAAAVGFRVTSLVVGEDGRFNAVMIPNESSDTRRQHMYPITAEELRKGLQNNRDDCRVDPAVDCVRVAEIAPTGVETFYVVLESIQRATSPYTGHSLVGEGEQSWLVAGLKSIPGGEDRPDSIQHVTKRLVATPTKLKPYVAADGTTRYVAVMVARGDLPESASLPSDNDAIRHLDALIQKQVRQAGLPGLTFGLMKDGNLIHTKSFGYRNMLTNEALLPSDSVRMASVSKQLTKAAILRLVEDAVPLPALPGSPGGPITRQTRPFGQIFPYQDPGLEVDLGDLTIQDFMYHLTGLRYDDQGACENPDDGDASDAFCDPFEWLMEVQDWVDTEQHLNTLEPPLQTANADKCGAFCLNTADKLLIPAEPGFVSRPDYMNSDYHLLGHVIRALTGLSPEAYIAHKFTSPLNLDGLRVSRPYGATEFPDAIQAANYARPEFSNITSWDERGDFILDNPARYPASSFIASPPHILRWQASIAGTRTGYRGIQDYQHMYHIGKGVPNIEHGGHLNDVTNAKINELTVGADHFVYFWASTSTPLNDGSEAATAGMFALDQELEGFLEAEGAALPTRDLFASYVQPPCKVYFHDVAMEDWHGCLDYQQALGLTPKVLTVNPLTMRVAGVFEARSPRLTHYLLPAATYNDVLVQQQGIGSYPLSTNVVLWSVGPRFSAIWEPTIFPAVSEWNLTPEAFTTAYHQRQGNGVLLTDFFPYDDDGLKFAGTWQRLPSDGYTIASSVTPAAWPALHTQRQAEGLKITHFVASEIDGQLLYAATWERLNGSYELEFDASSADYATTVQVRVGSGWRLHHLHSFGADSFASIWHKPAPGGGTLSFETAGTWSKTFGPGTIGSSEWGTAGKALTLTANSTETEIVSVDIPNAVIRANSRSGAPTHLAVDVLVPTQQPIPAYAGALKLHVSVPSAGISHQWQEQVLLTSLRRGEFVTVQIPLTSAVRSAITSAATRNVKLFLGLVSVTGAGNYSFDNIRFTP